MKQNVNVIYLTTRCNLNCDYCYEKIKRDEQNFEHRDISLSEIKDFIYDIECRENDVSSTICVMGGEPFLMPNAYSYLLDCIESSSKSGGYGLNLISNGTILTKQWINLIQRSYKLKNTSFNFHISYDGKSQYRRENIGRTLQTIKELYNLKIPFGISYTINRENRETWIYDLMKILIPYSDVMRLSSNTSIRINFAHSDMGTDPFDGKIQNEMRPYADELFKRFGIPLCQLS